MKRLQLQPLGENLLLQTGSTLLSALLTRQLSIKMSCGGRGFCSTCRVTVKQGMDQLSPPEARERKTLSIVANSTRECRLACQSRVYGDGIVVELPKGMYIEKMEDLLGLLGTRASEHILHPITGQILIPKDKLITRSLLEASRSLEKEVERLKAKAVGGGDSDSILNSSAIGGSRFRATGSGLAPDIADSGKSTLFLSQNTRLNLQSATRSQESSILAAPKANDPPRAESRFNAPDIPGASGLSRPPVVEPGATIGKFLLLERIGKGGSGVVYRALHTKMKATVAMKFLRVGDEADLESTLERFRNEAHLLAQLNHPNIVRILDFEDSPALPYVVMEYMDGFSALDLLRQSERLPLSRVLAIVRDVACGLRAAQQVGIIHRDVKPANILVTRDWTAKLADLGLALKMPKGGEEEARPGANRGEGTAAYMSPEQIMDLGAPIDHRADIYSLGVSFYHLLTGKLPYTGSTRDDIFAQHLSANPRPPRDHLPKLAPEVSDCVLRMMEMNPDRRPQTYDEVLEELAALVKEPRAAVLV